MHMLQRPELTIEYRDGGMRVALIVSQSGERIGIELDAQQAANWAAKIVAPRPQD
jgi:hypothetical protein